MGATCAAATLAADEWETEFYPLHAHTARSMSVADEERKTAHLLDVLFQAYQMEPGPLLEEKAFVAVQLATTLLVTDLGNGRQLGEAFCDARRRAQQTFRDISDGAQTVGKQQFQDWQRRSFENAPETSGDREATNMILEHNFEVCQCSAKLLREVLGPWPWSLDGDLPRGWKELAQELKKVPGKDDTAPEAAAPWGFLQEPRLLKMAEDQQPKVLKLMEDITNFEDILKNSAVDFYGFMTDKSFSGPADGGFFNGQPYAFEVPSWMDTWTCGLGGASGLLPQGFAASPGTVILAVVSAKPQSVPGLMHEALQKLRSWGAEHGTKLQRKAWHRRSERLPPHARKQLLTCVLKERGQLRYMEREATASGPDLEHLALLEDADCTTPAGSPRGASPAGAMVSAGSLGTMSPGLANAGPTPASATLPAKPSVLHPRGCQGPPPLEPSSPLPKAAAADPSERTRSTRGRQSRVDDKIENLRQFLMTKPELNFTEVQEALGSEYRCREVIEAWNAFRASEKNPFCYTLVDGRTQRTTRRLF